jgi:hypothetical protein
VCVCMSVLGTIDRDRLKAGNMLINPLLGCSDHNKTGNPNVFNMALQYI